MGFLAVMTVLASDAISGGKVPPIGEIVRPSCWRGGGALPRGLPASESRTSDTLLGRSSGSTASDQSMVSSSSLLYLPAPSLTAGTRGSLRMRLMASVGLAPEMQRYATAPSA